METILESLQRLGYSNKQSRVYASLLVLGKGSVQAIANQCGIKRPTVYVIVDELLEKGLISRIIASKKQIYVPMQPQAIQDQAEQALTEAKKCVPGLMALLARDDSHKIKTLYFEGAKGIERSLFYRMEELQNSEITAFFGSTEFATKELVQIFHKWNRALKENNISLRSISPKNKILKDFRKKDKEYGFKNKEMSQSVYSSKVSIDITDSFVRVLFFKEKQALIIESADFASALRQVFGMIWG